MDNLFSFEPTIIKLSKAYSIPPLRSEDIAQELRIQLFTKKDKYNPDRVYNHWAYIVCRNKIRSLARHWGREKRGIKKTISLEELKREI